MRDEESGELWGPTPLPIREEAWPYHVPPRAGLQPLQPPLARHRARPAPVRAARGSGEDLAGSGSTTTPAAPRRLSRHRLRRVGARRLARRHRAVRRHRGLDAATGALLARNAWTRDFAGPRRLPRPARAAQTGWTGDRASSSAATARSTIPEALERGEPLSGRVGAGLDPCGALQATLELAAGGEAGGRRPARPGRVGRPRRARSSSAIGPPTWTTCSGAVTTRWDDLLGAVQVKTPDRALDLMLNRWLLYQTLACRVWARAGFYQAGGAYGFRDQLQDVHGAGRGRARRRARAPAAGRGPPVRRGRRAALVASAVRPRRAHAHLRRPRLAALRRPRTTSAVTGDGARARRGGPVPRGAACSPTSSRGLLRAQRLRRARVALRALRAGARPEPRRRAPTACR